jgi:hypothetical protein
LVISRTQIILLNTLAPESRSKRSSIHVLHRCLVEGSIIHTHPQCSILHVDKKDGCPHMMIWNFVTLHRSGKSKICFIIVLWNVTPTTY